MKTTFLLLLLFSMLSAYSQDRTNEVLKATKVVNDRSLQGHIEQDLDMLLSAYTKVSIIVPPGGAPITGLRDLRNYYAEGFKNGRSLEISTETISFEVISKNTANQLGSYSIKYQSSGSNEIQTINGYMMIVWTKNENGEWKIKWDMWH